MFIDILGKISNGEKITDIIAKTCRHKWMLGPPDIDIRDITSNSAI